ncbi:MAG: hypothetical protein JWL70_1101 [Acidimicrobiia bacterium]|nr:hypothetical protein [Acidimicrobiia bacterium]
MTDTILDSELEAFAIEVGESGPVAVEGSRTRWNTGGTLADGTRLVRAPAGILEHVPDEMTVRVRAGTTVADLHAALAEAGQHTALPERGGTVGGALAVGENDVRAMGRGVVRQSLLQVRYISADGRVVKGGGPTVKNVSGFDLPRLIVGSLGTLGLIAEVILRTNPIPATSLWIRSLDVDPFVVTSVALRPSAVLWDGSATWVALEGHGADVDDQLSALERVATWSPVEGPPPLPSHRWSLAPADLRHLANYPTGAFVASVGIGTVFASQPQPARPVAPPLQELAQRVKQQFDPTGRLNPGRTPGTT